MMTANRNVGAAPPRRGAGRLEAGGPPRAAAKRGGGEVQKKTLAQGDGAASVSSPRLQVARGAMPEKRKRGPVVGVAEGSGGVGAWWAGLEAADQGDRQKCSDRPVCFSSGELRARSPAAGRKKPKAASPPFDPHGGSAIGSPSPLPASRNAADVMASESDETLNCLAEPHGELSHNNKIGRRAFKRLDFRRLFRIQGGARF